MAYDNPLLEKSLQFAARIVKLYQYLTKGKKETIISKQIIRSGTSIGANASEAVYGVSLWGLFLHFFSAFSFFMLISSATFPTERQENCGVALQILIRIINDIDKKISIICDFQQSFQDTIDKTLNNTII